MLKRARVKIIQTILLRLGYNDNDDPKALRTHILRLLGLKTILHRAFGPF